MGCSPSGLAGPAQGVQGHGSPAAGSSARELTASSLQGPFRRARVALPYPFPPQSHRCGHVLASIDKH